MFENVIGRENDPEAFYYKTRSLSINDTDIQKNLKAFYDLFQEFKKTFLKEGCISFKTNFHPQFSPFLFLLRIKTVLLWNSRQTGINSHLSKSLIRLTDSDKNSDLDRINNFDELKEIKYVSNLRELRFTANILSKDIGELLKTNDQSIIKQKIDHLQNLSNSINLILKDLKVDMKDEIQNHSYSTKNNGNSEETISKDINGDLVLK